MTLPVGSKATAQKLAAVSLQQPSKKTKSCPSGTLVIPSSPLILEILSMKRLALQEQYFKSWPEGGSGQRTCKQERKETKDHTALSLSSPVKMWPSITEEGTFSDWLEWDGSYPKLSWMSILSNFPWGCLSFLYSYQWEATTVFNMVPTKQPKC